MLKQFQDIFEVDERNRAFVKINPQTGELAKLTLAEHYESIASLALPAFVSEDVCKLYERGRNALLYAWFAYELTPVAQQQAFASLEVSLRRRALLERETPFKKNPSLGVLLDLAIQKGWIADEKFLDEELPAIQQTTKYDGKFLKHSKKVVLQAKKLITGPRNSIAHGEPFLLPPGIAMESFQLCRSLIRQIEQPE